MYKCDKDSGLLLQAKFEMDGFRNRDTKRLLQTFFGKSKQGNDFPTTRHVPCAPRHGLFSLHRALQKQTSQANDALTGLLSILIIILPHWMQLPSYTSKKNLSDTVSMFLFHSHRSQHKYIHSAYFSPRFPHWRYQCIPMKYIQSPEYLLQHIFSFAGCALSDIGCGNHHALSHPASMYHMFPVHFQK